MSSDLKDLPAIPEAGELTRPLRAMREAVQTMMGNRGEVDKAAVRWRDLVARGMVDRAFNATASGGAGTPGPPGPVGPPGPPGTTTPDLTPPPDVSNLAIVAGITNVIISWSGIGYPQGHGHKQALIYAVKKDPSDATLPTFGDAAVVAAAPNALTIISIPSEPNTRWHVWAKFETNDGVLSTSPAGGANGVTDTTGQDVTHLLEVLDKAITMRELSIALATPIGGVMRWQDDAAAQALAGALATYNEGKRRQAELLAEALDRGTAISDMSTVMLAGDAHLAQRITTLTASVEGNQSAALAAVQAEAAARASGDAAEATQRNTLATQVTGGYTGNNLSGLSSGLLFEERQARSTADASQVSSINTLTASVNSNTAAIQTETTVRASQTGHLGALYSVRVSLTEGGRTVAGGFGLMGTSGGSQGPEIEFGVRADRFWIGAPGGSTGVADVLPFIVQASPTTINGVAVPAAVYIDTALIRNGTITTAKVGDAQIDNAKIANVSAAKLTVGDGTVGGDLKSGNFVAGSAGWRIRPDGTAELSDAVFRGTIFAGAGTIGGITIGANYIQSSDYVLGSSGWRLAPTGAQLPATTIIGTLTTTQLALGAASTLVHAAVPNITAYAFSFGTPVSEFTVTAVSESLTTAGFEVVFEGYATVTFDFEMPAAVDYMVASVDPRIDGNAIYPATGGFPLGASLFTAVTQKRVAGDGGDSNYIGNKIVIPFMYTGAPPSGAHTYTVGVTVKFKDSAGAVQTININGYAGVGVIYKVFERKR